MISDWLAALHDVCLVLFGCRHAEVVEDLSEFLNDGTWKRGYTTNRLVRVC